MTKNQINARIKDSQTELAEVRRTLSSTQAGETTTEKLSEMNRRQGELQAEIAALMAMLDEL